MAYANVDLSVLHLDKEDGKYYGLSAIKKMTLGMSIQNIETDGVIEISGGLCVRSIDGLLYSDDGAVLLVCPFGRKGHVEIAGGTERIAANAFEGTHVTSVKFPDTLHTICEKAFVGCNIKEVTFPTSVEHIGRHNFQAARVFHIPGGKPIFGLFESWFLDTETILDMYKWGDLDAEDGEPQYVIIDMAGKAFAMPLSYSGAQSSMFRSKWDAGVLDIGLAQDAFMMGATAAARRETAFAAYVLNPQNKAAKQLLAEEADLLSARLLKENRNKELAQLLRMWLISQEWLQKLLGFAQKHGNRTAQAYILEAIGKAADSRDTLKL